MTRIHLVFPTANVSSESQEAFAAALMHLQCAWLADGYQVFGSLEARMCGRRSGREGRKLAIDNSFLRGIYGSSKRCAGE